MRLLVLVLCLAAATPAAVLACAASEGYATDAEGIIIPGRGDMGLVDVARQIASALCDADSDGLNFAAKVTVHLYVTSSPHAVVQVTSFRLAEVLGDKEALRNLATSYGGALARDLGFPVYVAFFHFRADDAGTARATYRLTLEEGELRVAPVE